MTDKKVTYRITLDVTYDPTELLNGVFPIASPEDWAYSHIFAAPTFETSFVSASLYGGEL